jgi:hypothetical protein
MKASIIMLTLVALNLWLVWDHQDVHYGRCSASFQGLFGMRDHSTRLMKLTIVYGPNNQLYERAIKTHHRHAERWGHESRTLRQEMATNFWNKPTFMLQALLDELQKPPADRVEWLM